MAEDEVSEVRYFSAQWLRVRVPSCQQEIETLFEERIHRTWGRAEHAPKLDAHETAGEFVIEIDLPGVDPESLRVSIDGRRISIEAVRSREESAGIECVHLRERPMGRFFRMLDLPFAVDPRSARQRLANGVLRLVVPKPASLSGA